MKTPVWSSSEGLDVRTPPMWFGPDKSLHPRMLTKGAKEVLRTLTDAYNRNSALTPPQKFAEVAHCLPNKSLSRPLEAVIKKAVNTFADAAGEMAESREDVEGKKLAQLLKFFEYAKTAWDTLERTEVANPVSWSVVASKLRHSLKSTELHAQQVARQLPSQAVKECPPEFKESLNKIPIVLFICR